MPAMPSDIPAVPDWEPIQLSVGQQFEIERHSRLLDEVDDVATLRNLAKMLLQSWIMQQAATKWAISQGGLKR
jgi:hypothetical protein